MAHCEFVIPYPPTKAGKTKWSKRFGLNAFWAGKCWQARKADADYWHKIVWSEMARQNIPKKPFKDPVKIRFWFNDRLDIDNDSVFMKLTIDAMKGWVIQDDNKKYVQSVELNCHSEGSIHVSVETMKEVK